MGAAQSNGVDQQGGKEETDAASEYVLISQEEEETLTYDPSESYLVAFCINRQTSPRFKHRQLNDTVINDSFKIMSALQDSGAVPRSNTNMIQASIESELCTFVGMKKAFVREAKKVGSNGAFYFHFSGHGIRVNSDQFGLAPMDFDYTEETYVTASVLNDWLREAQCKAKYIVFTIDCCYAGGLAEALTKGSEKLAPFPGHYVLAACTADEVSVIIGTLGNSIFSYFLSHSIRAIPSQQGQFQIRQIYEKCKKLCFALSSLLLSYNKSTGLHWRTMQPELTHSNLSQSVLQMIEGGEDQTDSGIMRFNYATELYDYTRGKDQLTVLDPQCTRWLEMTYTDPNGGLSVLKSEGIIGVERSATDTILCCMLRSVASIQQACDPVTVATPNLYITSYMHVVAAIDITLSGSVEFHEREFALGLAYYQDSLLHTGVDTEPLKQLYQSLLANLRQKIAALRESGEDMTDSGELVSQSESRTPALSLPPWPTIQRWTPL